MRRNYRHIPPMLPATGVLDRYRSHFRETEYGSVNLKVLTPELAALHQRLQIVLPSSRVRKDQDTASLLQELFVFTGTAFVDRLTCA
ncbi:hypothetical protein [Paenibacillus periandrae]|uniref:hypothetical protein n=1 Tax=Paenibacillus periandrae TaxID=1761741 RepID=UPI001F08D017|nr:hypothetical protein [Paenibacillus periandrae]